MIIFHQMAVMIFKRAVFESRRKPKEILRPKLKNNLKDAEKVNLGCSIARLYFLSCTHEPMINAASGLTPKPHPKLTPSIYTVHTPFILRLAFTCVGPQLSTGV